jgi:hypothetical protein
MPSESTATSPERSHGVPATRDRSSRTVSTPASRRYATLEASGKAATVCRSSACWVAAKPPAPLAIGWNRDVDQSITIWSPRAAVGSTRVGVVTVRMAVG